MAQINIEIHQFMKFAPKERKEVVQKTPGDFAGWISRSWDMAWVVSPERRDKRSGIVSSPADKSAVENNYVLQYEVKQPGERHRQARFHRIEASNPEEAVQRAHSFMHSIGLDQGGRSRSTLFCNEKEIKLKEARHHEAG